MLLEDDIITGIETTHVFRFVALLLLALGERTLVDPDVTGELVAPGEALVAARVGARVRLLSGVRADVTGLTTQAGGEEERGRGGERHGKRCSSDIGRAQR